MARTLEMMPTWCLSISPHAAFSADQPDSHSGLEQLLSTYTPKLWSWGLFMVINRQ